jgi:probable HAF family extracellular repeat protein
MQDLGDLPGGFDHSEARAINNNGHVAGTGRAATGDHAFLWSTLGGMQDLGELVGGADASHAYDINDSDQVVGNSLVANENHAFLWTRSEGMMDLNSLLDASGAGWTLNFAHGINNAGQIVGYAKNSEGIVHGFLLTPIPEPSTWGLGLASLSVLAREVRRRRGPAAARR